MAIDTTLEEQLMSLHHWLSDGGRERKAIACPAILNQRSRLFSYSTEEIKVKKSWFSEEKVIGIRGAERGRGEEGRSRLK